MFLLQMLPVILSLVILAAHFLRRGDVVTMVVLLAMVALLAVPRVWAARILQAVLLLGAAEWTRTLVTLVRVRAEHDLPATRMVIILVAVVVLTAGSALLFQTWRARAHFRIAQVPDSTRELDAGASQ